jgi:hypothetical protein
VTASWRHLVTSERHFTIGPVDGDETSSLLLGANGEEAMAEKNDNLITPEFRVAFAHVFEPREGENGDKWELVMIFDKSTDITALKTAAGKAAREKWGDAAGKMKLDSPFHDGTEKVDREGNVYDGFGPGVVYLRASSTFQPGIVDAHLKPIIDRTAFYSGCYARAEVNAFAYDRNGKRGVSFGLRNLQKLRDGKSLGFRVAKAEEVFSPVGSSIAAPPAEAGDPLFG